jgi:hypothetical protein
VVFVGGKSSFTFAIRREENLPPIRRVAFINKRTSSVMKKTFLLSFALFGFAIACKTPAYTPDDYPKMQIRFGSGGGFTGMVTEYALFENGRLFKKEGKVTAAFTEQKKPASKLVKTAFATLENVRPFLTDFNHPGNLYRFIEIRSEGKVQRITWGDEHAPVDDRVRVFYSILNKTVQGTIE